ncbi:MAG: hypothetical protein R3A44_39930 [Caldilineaceae bacterium]
MHSQLALFVESNNYRSYLVRLWRDTPPAPWRLSAQCIQTGEIRHFADLTALFVFLQALMSDSTEVRDHNEQTGY